MEIREEVMYQGPEEQTEAPTEDELWEIYALIKVTWASEKMPQNWQTAIILPYIRREIKWKAAVIEESPY